LGHTQEILGANYAFTVALPIANTALEAPIFGESPRPGLSDMYVQRSISAGISRALTSRQATEFTCRPADTLLEQLTTLGLGVWGHELFVGSAVFWMKRKLGTRPAPLPSSFTRGSGVRRRMSAT